MTTYYVDSGSLGDDNNNGTSQSTPWKTITKVNNTTFAAGDYILFKRGGTWSGVLRADNNGASGSRITYGSYGVGALPTINDGGNQRSIEVTGTYVTIEEIHTYGSDQHDDEHAGILIDGIYCIVRDCDIEHTTIGVKVNAENALITRNYIHDLWVRVRTGSDDDYGANGISIRSSYCEISYNEIARCVGPSPDYGSDGGAIETYTSTITIRDVEVHHNYIHDGDGIWEVGGRTGGYNYDYLFHHNVCVNNGGRLFTLHNITGGTAFVTNISNMRVENNTFVENDGGIDNSLWFAGVSSPTEFYFRNNIHYKTFGFMVNNGRDQFTHDYNIFFGGMNFWYYTRNAHEPITDPLFADYANEDYQLQAGSPAIDAGINLGYTLDYNDTPIPQNGLYDIGAYEYVTGGSTEPSLDDYTYSAAVTIPGANIATALANFVVLVSGTFDGTGGQPDLRTAANGGHVQNRDPVGPPADFTFSDSTKTIELDFEVDHYDPVTGEIVCWVKVPSMDAGTDATIYMIYGNGAVTTKREDVTATWSAYTAVYHLDQASGTLYDATGGANSTAENVTRSQPGIVYHGVEFDETVPHRVDLPAIALGDASGTLIAWVNIPSNAADGSRHAVLGRYYGTTALAVDQNADGLYPVGVKTLQLFGSAQIPLNTWTMLAYAADSGGAALFINDGSPNTNADTGTWRNESEPWAIGSQIAGSDEQSFNGRVDEVRLLTNRMTTAWIQTLYRCMTNLPTVGQELPGTDELTASGVATQSPVIVLPDFTEVAAPSYDYTYFSEITIPASSVSGVQVDFPVFISGAFDGTGGLPDLRSAANGGNVEVISGGKPIDLVFSSSYEGTPFYDFEITNYDPVTGALTAWVRIPQIADIKDETFYLCYGNNTHTENQENPAGVWGGDHLAVYHLDEASGTLYDATVNDNDSTAEDAVHAATGLVDSGILCESANEDQVDLPAIAMGGNTGTITFWMKQTSVQASGWRAMVSRDYTGAGIVTEVSGTPTTIGIAGVVNGTVTVFNKTVNLLVDTWYMVTMVADGTNVLVYVNDHQSFQANPDNWRSETAQWALGAGVAGGGYQHFDGVLDEVRFMSGARSQSWVQTTYNLMSTPLSPGVEQTGTPTSPEDQKLYPTADVYDGSWTNELGSNTDLYASVDESVADDNDYIQSEAAPISSPVVLKLEAGVAPITRTSHYITYRFYRYGNVALDMLVELRQGYVNESSRGTLIASWTHTDVGETVTEAVKALTTQQASLITDYSDLYVRIVAQS